MPKNVDFKINVPNTTPAVIANLYFNTSTPTPSTPSELGDHDTTQFSTLAEEFVGDNGSYTMLPGTQLMMGYPDIAVDGMIQCLGPCGPHKSFHLPHTTRNRSVIHANFPRQPFDVAVMDIVSLAQD